MRKRKPRAPEYLVYVLIDPRTQLVRYVGQSWAGLKERMRSHRWPRKPWCHSKTWIRSLQKQGLDFEYAVVDTATSREHLNVLEVWWIAYGRACGWDLTNHTAGGDGATGRVISEAERALSRERFTGDKNPAKRPEVRAKISKSTQGRFKGVPKSPETRARMSAAAMGKPKSPEHRAKITAQNRARALIPISEETRARISAGTRRGLEKRRAS